MPAVFNGLLSRHVAFKNMPAFFYIVIIACLFSKRNMSSTSSITDIKTNSLLTPLIACLDETPACSPDKPSAYLKPQCHLHPALGNMTTSVIDTIWQSWVAMKVNGLTFDFVRSEHFPGNNILKCLNLRIAV